MPLLALILLNDSLYTCTVSFHLLKKSDIPNWFIGSYVTLFGVPRRNDLKTILNGLLNFKKIKQHTFAHFNGWDMCLDHLLQSALKTTSTMPHSSKNWFGLVKNCIKFAYSNRHPQSFHWISLLLISMTYYSIPP